MGIPQYAEEGRFSVRDDEQLNNIRSSYISMFANLVSTDSRSMLNVNDHFHLIQTTLEYGMRQLEKRILMTLESASLQDLRDVVDLENKLMRKEYHMMRNFVRDLKIEETPDYEDEVEPEIIEKGSHPIRTVLERYHSELISQLEINGTLLLDVLVSENLLTDVEEEHIKSGWTRGEQNRRVLTALCTLPPGKDVTGFIQFMKENYKALGNKIEDSLTRGSLQPVDGICAACTVTATIDPARIAATMFERQEIPPLFYEDLVNPNIPNNQKWKMIKDNDFAKAAIMALKPRYQHYYNLFPQRITDLTCRCEAISTNSGNSRFCSSRGELVRTRSLRNWSDKTSRNRDYDSLRRSVGDIRRSLQDLRSEIGSSVFFVSDDDIRFHRRQHRKLVSDPRPALEDQKKKKKKKHSFFSKLKKSFIRKRHSSDSIYDKVIADNFSFASSEMLY